MKIIKLFTIFLLCFTPLLHANDEKQPAKKEFDKFSGSATFGLVHNTGNTDSQNLNLGANITIRPFEHWRNKLVLSSQIVAADGIRNRERYQISDQSNYYFTDRFYAYLTFDLLFDRFGPFERQYDESFGPGFLIIDSEKLTLDVQAGPGLRQSYAQGTKEFKRETTIYTQAELNWKITDTASFNQLVNVIIGDNNTNTRTVSALTMKVVKDLGVQISYTVDHNTYIPPRTKKRMHTDTITNVSLIYSFS